MNFMLNECFKIPTDDLNNNNNSLMGELSSLFFCPHFFLEKKLGQLSHQKLIL